MSLSEFLLLVILGACALFNICFSITGRIRSNRIHEENRKNREEDLKRAYKSLEMDTQIKVLTNRIGEICTKNHNLMEDNRGWKRAYDELFVKYKDLQEKYDKLTSK